MMMKIRQQCKSNKGFTLVELMVVIAILGILAAIAIPKFASSSATANGAKVAADLRSIDSAISIFAATNGVSQSTVTAANATTMLTVWPTPPTGDVIFNAKGYTVGAAYTVTAGRATIDLTGKAVAPAAAGATKTGASVEDLGK